jgi:hypothetical protein
VFLERATDETGFRETERNRPQPETKPVAQPAHLQAQQLVALVEPFTAPLVAQIADLSRENGRLQAERDAAAKAADALREENAFLRAIQAEQAQKPSPATDDVSEPSNEDSACPGETGDAVSGPETVETHPESVVASLWRRLFGRG